MKTSAKGIALLKQFEGCRLNAYRDNVGVWTIGYGITSAAGHGPVLPGMTITQDQADQWLLDVLGTYENAVCVPLTRKPTQNQFDAMVSLCYNIGAGAFAKSTVVRLFNAGQMAGAGKAFLRWNKAGGKVLPGLITRRTAEMGLFLTPDSSAPAPEAPKVVPDAPVKAEPPSLQKVMAWIVGAVIALIAAYLGLGDK